MLDINLIQSTSSWPFVEVRKLLKDRKELIKKKNKHHIVTGDHEDIKKDLDSH